MAGITIQVNHRSTVFHNGDCDRLPYAELQTLLQDLRAVAMSVEGELMKRQPTKRSDQTREVGRCCEQLHKSAQGLPVTERLHSKAAKHVNEAVDILLTLDPVSSSRLYQEFLFDVFYQCNAGIALLCAASLGKRRILDLGASDRIHLLAYVKYAQQSLESPILGVLSRQYRMPAANSSEIAHIKVDPRDHGKLRDTQEGEMSLEKKNILRNGNETQIQTNDSPPMLYSDRLKRRRMETIDSSRDREQNKVSTESKLDSVKGSSQTSVQPNHSHSPKNELREMKYMCTNAPIDTVAKLLEPFRTAIQNSRLWRWERDQGGMETTSCLATLFPKDSEQDVSFTIWYGFDDGHYLSNTFGLQLAVSS